MRQDSDCIDVKCIGKGNGRKCGIKNNEPVIAMLQDQKRSFSRLRNKMASLKP